MCLAGCNHDRDRDRVYVQAAGLDGVINKLVPGGLVNKAGAVLDKDVIRDDFGHAHVNISNLTLHGLASFSELIFPRAASSESIEMAATIDSTGKVDTSIPTADAKAPARDPIGISFRTRMDYEPSADRGSSAILNDFTTDIKFDNLALATTLTALVNRSRLAQQRLSDLSFQNLVRSRSCLTWRFSPPTDVCCLAWRRLLSSTRLPQH